MKKLNGGSLVFRLGVLATLASALFSSALAPLAGGTSVADAAGLTAQLISPANGSRLQAMGPIALNWQNPVATTQVHIRVLPYNGDGPSINMIVGDALLVNSGSYIIQSPLIGDGNYILLPDMTYTWQVRASSALHGIGENDDSWGPWSAQWRFETPARSSSTISPISFSNGERISENSTVLQWRNAASDVFFYEVQLSTDSQMRTGADAVAAVYWNLIHGGASNPVNAWQTPVLESGKTYYWRVRPRVQGDGRAVGWSAIWSFRTEGSVSPAPAPAPAPSSSLEQETLNGINFIRQQNGLRTLSVAGAITAAAVAHSADMAAADQMSHSGTDGSNAGQRMAAAGYTWRMYGEIVAAGYNTPEAVVNAWMNSPTHKAVIMMPDFNEFGIGLQYSAAGRAYWTVNFGTP